MVGVGHLIVTRYPRFESAAITGRIGFMSSQDLGAAEVDRRLSKHAGSFRLATECSMHITKNRHRYMA